MLESTIQAPTLAANTGAEPSPSKSTEVTFKTNGAISYEVLQEYGKNVDVITHNAGWCLAVIRLDKPNTYSRKDKRSIGDVVSGAYQRRSKPFIIFDDCVQLNITRSCSANNFIKTLNAVLQNSVNYLSANVILPGDWILAWCHNDLEYTKGIIKKLLNNTACNDFMDGLKFVGRVHSIRKSLSVGQDGKKFENYSLQAISFGELESTFYYDVELATALAKGSNQDLALWMAQLGINWTNFVTKQSLVGAELVDNIEEILSSFIDIVVGKGGPKTVNEPSKAAYSNNEGILNNKLDPNGRQASAGIPGMEEAPYSYLVPVSVAQILGKEVVDKSKKQVFGYSDILHVLMGVQQYDKTTVDSASRGFWPVLEKGSRNSANRSFCQERIKGTYIPSVEGNFINRPLWQILQQFLNQSINQMYTSLKVGKDGKIMPTLVVRQIPFSTNSIKENSNFLLTRFLDLPRWKIDPKMVNFLDLGRSDATRKNMVKVTGDPSVYAPGPAQQDGFQVMMHPPIFDTIDVARSGLKPHTQVVNCSTTDLYREDGFDVWSEAIADWTFGSQNTLNGSIRSIGIQSPIAEGDNLEFEGIVYHIESITDSCMIAPNGVKQFHTTISVSNGIPIEQKSDYIEDYPVYPGFNNMKSDTVGDDTALSNSNPGVTIESNNELNREGV